MKKLKVAQVIGILLLLIGMIIRISGDLDGMWMVIVGVMVYATARVSAWVKSD